MARAARVHRSFIYRHGDLHAAVHDQAASDSTPSDGTRASRQALRADLANALERSTRQTQRISQLEKKLSHVLGDNAWRESGLGAPTDIDALQQRITSLEQQLADVTAQLAARDDDLDAARNANRELMAQLNHRGNMTLQLTDSPINQVSPVFGGPRAVSDPWGSDGVAVERDAADGGLARSG